MVKISVVTPTIRGDESLKLIDKSLLQQTFRDFEWIVCSPSKPSFDCIWVEDTFKGGYWGLNRAYNALFKASRGELIVTWQDWIYSKPDTLDKFWTNYKNTNGCISGVGGQYSDLDEYGKPVNKVWADPRRTSKYGSFYECIFNDCEWNLAAIPKKHIYTVGGMDEKLDFLGFGGDQLQICERMNDAGVKFYLDQTLESFTLRHDRKDFGGQEKWDDNHVVLNGKYDLRKEELKRSGEWPDIGMLKYRQ